MSKAPVPDEPLHFIKQCVSSGRIRSTYHVSMRLQQRNLRSDMLVAAVDSFEIVENYEEKSAMRCRMCGGVLEARTTDLPFKVGDFSIVILKALPVLQCRQCGETELEHQTMLRVDQLLSAVDKSAELEVIRYAA